MWMSSFTPSCVLIITPALIILYFASLKLSSFFPVLCLQPLDYLLLLASRFDSQKKLDGPYSGFHIRIMEPDLGLVSPIEKEIMAINNHSYMVT